MSRLKKATKVIGWISLGVVGSLAVAFLVAGYVAAFQAPILPSKPARVDISSWDEGRAYISGTWTYDDTAAPLQTSQIICKFQSGLCEEVRAEIRLGNLLNVDTETFVIKKWDRETIIFTDDSQCFQEIYTVTRASLRVSGTRLLKKSNDCAFLSGSKTRLELTLTDGLKAGLHFQKEKQAKNVPFTQAGVALLWLIIAWRIVKSIKA